MTSFTDTTVVNFKILPNEQVHAICMHYMHTVYNYALHTSIHHQHTWYSAGWVWGMVSVWITWKLEYAGPLTYFHCPIGPCCCGKLGYGGPPHLFFRDSITGYGDFWLTFRMQFWYHGSIEYRDTRGGIVIVVPVSGIAQHYFKQAGRLNKNRMWAYWFRYCLSYY